MPILSDIYNLLSKPEVQESLVKGFKWLRQLKPQENPFSEVSEVLLSTALVNSVGIVLDDRFDRNIENGGWGESEIIYEKDVFGAVAINRPKDSIMYTSVAIIALRACTSLLRGCEETKPRRELLIKIEDVIKNCMSDYIEPRWDEKNGHGGNLTYGRNNEIKMVISYRHTAWLLKLWLEDRRYKNIQITYKYLLDKFSEQNWHIETVNTDISAYVALKSILEDQQYSKVLDIDKIPVYLDQLKSSVLNKHKASLFGWASEYGDRDNESRRLATRQAYTILVLTEMAHLCNDVDDGYPTKDLVSCMQDAFNETMNGEWKACDSKYGVPKMKEERANIGLSCLFASALLRKPNKTYEEIKYLKGVINFVVTSLADNSNCANDSYLWTVCYFIKDTCDFLSHRRAN